VAERDERKLAEDGFRAACMNGGVLQRAAEMSAQEL